MWSQTPQFDLLLDKPDDIGIDMNVHHGIIKSLELKRSRLTKKTQDSLRRHRRLGDISANPYGKFGRPHFDHCQATGGALTHAEADGLLNMDAKPPRKTWL
jgi:hypothetical protein